MPKTTRQELSDTDRAFDYSHVANAARVAVYDDMLMPPHVIEVPPAPTVEFIESLAVCINEQKNQLGGKIPYNAIREVAENFIHAQFNEVVVSILDGGNTIRFCDQGPGIADKHKAQQPGFSSATEDMKSFIKGVGSGLPMVKEYLNLTHGTLVIEDNIEHGAAVTISLANTNSLAALHPRPTKDQLPTKPVAHPILSERERQIMELFRDEQELGVTEIVNLTGISGSTVHLDLTHLEEYGLLERGNKKKRTPTEQGLSFLSSC